MYHYLKIFELKPECVELYRKRHQHAHLEHQDHLEALKASGCVTMRGFLYENLSILYTESTLPPEEFARETGGHEACRQWHDETIEWFAKTNPDGSYQYILAEKIFDVTEQLQGILTER